MLAAVIIALISIVPIAMIVVGSMNLHNCPAEKYLPIYLVPHHSHFLCAIASPRGEECRSWAAPLEIGRAHV